MKGPLLLLALCGFAACAPSLKPPAGVSLCTTEQYDMAYRPGACEPCVNIPCRGPELPPCSVCGDRACVRADAGSFCCAVPPPPEEPCKPQVQGAP